MCKYTMVNCIARPFPTRMNVKEIQRDGLPCTVVITWCKNNSIIIICDSALKNRPCSLLWVGERARTQNEYPNRAIAYAGISVA